MATRRQGLRVVRRGTKRNKTLRTYIVGANNEDLMGSTQGYDDPRDRANAEELALEALFKDPVLQHVAFRLAEELIQQSMFTAFDVLTTPIGRVLQKTADGLKTITPGMEVKPNK